MGQCLAKVEVHCREIAAALGWPGMDLAGTWHGPGMDLAALAKRYRHAQAQDYFHPELAEQVGATLATGRSESASESDAEERRVPR